MLPYIFLINLTHMAPSYDNIMCAGYHIWFEKQYALGGSTQVEKVMKPIRLLIIRSASFH